MNTAKQRMPQESDVNAQVRELLALYRRKIDKLQAKLADYEDYSSRREEAMSLGQQPYYNDIGNVMDEVLEYARTHGVSAKEAYNALYAESKANDMYGKVQKQKARISALSQEGNKADGETDTVLTADELWAAKKAGISPAEYLKFKKRGNE